MNQSIALSDHIETLLGLDRYRVNRLNLHRCTPNWSWDPAPFTDFDLWLVFDGVGELRVNGQLFAMQAGRGMLMQPGDKAYGKHRPGKPLTVFACHFQPTIASGQTMPRLAPGLLPIQTEQTEHLRLLAERAVSAAQRGGADNSLTRLLVAEMLFLTLTPAGHEVGSTSEDPLTMLAVRIQSEPERDWSLEAMARRCHLSIPQFTRTFRKRFGISARKFVIQQRIDRAGQLLRETRLSIAQVAEAVGYSDHYFFHRQFKQVTGRTPGQCRKASDR